MFYLCFNVAIYVLTGTYITVFNLCLTYLNLIYQNSKLITIIITKRTALNIDYLQFSF